MSGAASDEGALPSVSVVMPTYNRRGSIEHVLAPLLAEPELTEVVVVVDGCADGTYELLEALRTTKDARITPILVPNGGAASARQVGAERTRGEVLLVLDDDVVAEPGLVRGHAELHRRERSCVAVGYMPTTLPPVRRSGAFATYLYAQEYERHCQRWEERPDTVLSTLWMGNISLRREDALRVGLVDERMPSGYHVDRDFGIRCRDVGLRGVFDRSLRATHAHHRPLASFRRDARDQGASMATVRAVHGADAGVGDRGERDLPVAVRLVVGAAHIEWLIRPIAWMLACGVRLAGAIRAFEIELLLARFLRRVEYRRGEVRRRSS